MTIFSDEDLEDTPILTDWQIVGGTRRAPQLFGRHAFHEGERIAAVEIILVDPVLKSVLTLQADHHELRGPPRPGVLAARRELGLATTPLDGSRSAGRSAGPDLTGESRWARK